MESENPTSPSGPTLVNPRERRRNRLIRVPLEDGTYVEARRVDMTTLVFEGLVPMPLLAAAQKLTGHDAEPMDAFGQMDDDTKSGFMTTLRRYAVKAVVNPVVVLQDNGNDDHMAVEDFSFTELITIWNATAHVPLVTPAAAERFRVRPQQLSPVDVPPREDVRPSPAPVADVVEFKHA
jgi:hypothetical protein